MVIEVNRKPQKRERTPPIVVLCSKYSEYEGLSSATIILVLGPIARCHYFGYNTFDL